MRIQFKSVVKDGVIQVPEQYRNFLWQDVQVTVLANDFTETLNETYTGRIFADDFLELKLDTRGWKFDREEANERR